MSIKLNPIKVFKIAIDLQQNLYLDAFDMKRSKKKFYIIFTGIIKKNIKKISKKMSDKDFDLHF